MCVVHGEKQPTAEDVQLSKPKELRAARNKTGWRLEQDLTGYGARSHKAQRVDGK